MKRSHLYKKPEAVRHANVAHSHMLMAIDHLLDAEKQLKLSGYSGAAHGIHQANERVKSWLAKVDAEVKP